MANDGISEVGRNARFEQWEKYGADRLRADLEADPYRRVGSKAVQDLAWEFVRLKEIGKAPPIGSTLRALGLGPPSVTEILGEQTDLDQLVNTALAISPRPQASASPSPQATSVSEEKGELFIFKPNFHGIGINFNEAVRRLRRRLKKP